MMIPPELSVSGFRVPSLVLFLLLGVLTLIYVFWYEGKREGFDQEKLFDLVFVLSFISLLALKIDILIVIGLILILVYIVSRYRKWSVFRIMDIFVLSVYAGMVPLSAGYILISGKFQYLPVIFAVIFSYILFSRLRNRVLKSGYVFSFLLVESAAISFYYLRGQKYLLFYFLLVIMSLINLYLRGKKTMNKPNFSLQFLNELRQRLLSKDKQLKAQQKLLLQEDPYRDPGRAEDNAEMMDEAILEDNRKELTDIKVSALSSMRTQVRKALAKMKIGNYGVCDVCGKPIDPARLKAYPEATTCLEHSSHESQ